jgi:hypothetical protein
MLYNHLVGNLFILLGFCYSYFHSLGYIAAQIPVNGSHHSLV